MALKKKCIHLIKELCLSCVIVNLRLWFKWQWHKEVAPKLAKSSEIHVNFWWWGNFPMVFPGESGDLDGDGSKSVKLCCTCSMVQPVQKHSIWCQLGGKRRQIGRQILLKLQSDSGNTNAKMPI